MKSEADVKELKRQWLEDPSWDIETTDGFEEHHEALAVWAKAEVAAAAAEELLAERATHARRSRYGYMLWEKLVREIVAGGRLPDGALVQADRTIWLLERERARSAELDKSEKTS